MRARTRRHLSQSSRWRTVGVALSSLVLAAGCGGESPTDAPASESTSSSSSSTRSSTSKTTTSETTPETEAGGSKTPSAISPAAAGPTLIECIYGGGAWTTSGWMSDGSHEYHPQCAALRNEQLARYPYVCPRTDHHVADLSECAYPTGIPVPPAPRDPAAVDQPVETKEPTASPVEPTVEAEPGPELCEPGDTSQACQE